MVINLTPRKAYGFWYSFSDPLFSLEFVKTNGEYKFITVHQLFLVMSRMGDRHSGTYQTDFQSRTHELHRSARSSPTRLEKNQPLWTGSWLNQRIWKRGDELIMGNWFG